MISFDKIVHKLWTKKSSIILIDDLVELVDPDNSRAEVGMREVYKIVYRLKSEWHMLALRNGLFLLGPKVDAKSEVELIESHYWEIARAYIKSEVGSEYVIGGAKALEFHIADMSTPASLIVYTRFLSKQVILSKNHRLIFKKRETWKRSSGSLFPKLLPHVLRKTISGIDFKMLNHEASLLDVLLLQNSGGVIDTYLILKFLKKYHHTLQRNILGNLVELRYISSINRLREIAKSQGYDRLYRDCVSIIRDEWAGCFLASKVSLYKQIGEIL